jgi:hypothetical protein
METGAGFLNSSSVLYKTSTLLQEHEILPNQGKTPSAAFLAFLQASIIEALLER